jgi:alkylhydroperoxidase family enzyme
LSLCNGIRADGGRCRAQAMRGSDYCINHDPNEAEARKRRASKGGKRGGRGRPLAELGAVKRQLRELADDVVGGSADRSSAAVAAQVLNVYLRAVSVEAKVREQEEFEERLAGLEKIAEQQAGTGRAWQG